MTTSIGGTTGVTFPDLSVQNTAATGFGFKNRIINGAMVIDQRNAGAAVTVNGAFPVDRFQVSQTTDGAFSAQQDSSAPTGFVNSVKVTTTTADGTLTTTQRLTFSQIIEGTNISDLAWGTANAKTVTLSFWVRSSLTGTFGGSFVNSATDRSYPFTYSISAADTWEQKSITIAGDTTGTWLTTTGIGIRVFFGLGVGPDRSGTAGAWAASNLQSATGAVSVIGTLNATWYVTGVQLEKGSTATSFDYRPYGTELALCQRYFVKTNTSNIQRCGGLWGTTYTSTAGHLTGLLPVPMRTAPTVSAGGTSNTFYMSNVNATSAGTFGTFSTSELTIDAEVSSMSASSTGHPIQYNGQLSIASEL
jgi:hypothetical protein